MTLKYKRKNEYSQKEAMRVHTLDDHTKICKDCHGGMVVLLNTYSNVIGICIQTNNNKPESHMSTQK